MAYIINIVGIHSPGCEYGIKAKKMASFPYFLTWAVYLNRQFALLKDADTISIYYKYTQRDIPTPLSFVQM